MVYFQLGRPIIFKQFRPGLYEKPFKFYKFRTMKNEKDKLGKLLPDEQRLNFFGKFLRKTSLDELPSFWNVLKGDMSIVGPRPLLMEYIALYSPRESMRHNVKPGITGWAQINGRNNLPWGKKFSLDIWYVKNRTFKIDILIIYKTILKVIKMENISQKGHVTVEKFSGRKNGKD